MANDENIKKIPKEAFAPPVKDILDVLGDSKVMPSVKNTDGNVEFLPGANGGNEMDLIPLPPNIDIPDSVRKKITLKGAGKERPTRSDHCC